MTGILISDLLTRRLNPYPASTRFKSNRRATRNLMLVSELYGREHSGSVLPRYHFWRRRCPQQPWYGVRDEEKRDEQNETGGSARPGRQPGAARRRLDP